MAATTTTTTTHDAIAAVVDAFGSSPARYTRTRTLACTHMAYLRLVVLVYSISCVMPHAAPDKLSTVARLGGKISGRLQCEANNLGGKKCSRRNTTAQRAIL